MKRLSSIALLGAFLALGATACDSDTGPEPGVQSITVTPTDVNLNVGETANLSASVSTTGGASADVTWTSSNNSVASVDGNGVVTAVAEGNTTVTATSVADQSKKASVSVSVTTPAPKKITIASYRAVSNEETDNDGPVSSPDTLGTMCCEPATTVSPFTVLEVTYDVETGGKEIDRVQMLLNGEVVAEQVVSADRQAALATADENITLSKNTLDYSGSLDGAVKSPDVPNGTTELSGNVVFSDGTSRSVQQSRTVYVKNHQRFIVAHTDGGNTAVDSDGDRWFGGEDVNYAVTLIDHFGIGLSRVTVDPSPSGASFDIGAGAGTARTLMGGPYTFGVGNTTNAGVFGDFRLSLSDPRDGAGEAYGGTSQTIPWTTEFVQNFNVSASPPLMLLDFAAPSASGEIAVENAEDGQVEASGTQFFSTGVFVVPSGSDPGVGIIDTDAAVFNVERPATGTASETFPDVNGIADLPERVEDMEVILAELPDVLGNTNTSTGISTSPFGVDKTDPTATQEDEIGDAATIIKAVPDMPMTYGLLFSAEDPDNPDEPTDGTAGLALDFTSGSIIEVTSATVTDASGTTVLSATSADGTGGSGVDLDYDRNDDGTNGDFFFDIHDGGTYEGPGFTISVVVRDSSSANNNTTLEVGPFAIDRNPPQTTVIDPPSANISSSQNSLQFTMEARTTDAVDIDNITVFVETPGADDDCTTRGDNGAFPEGGSAGEVDVNEVELVDDYDGDSFEFSNDSEADADALAFVIQNTGDGTDQSVCWVVSATDDAQDNMGNPDPWANDRITRTDIDWQ